MANLIWGSHRRVLDSNGDPVSGGKIYIYAAGTTTPATTYSDNDLTVAHAFPVVANAAGVAAQMYVAAGEYKVRVTDADDVVLREDDYVLAKAPSVDAPSVFSYSPGADGETNDTAAFTALEAAFPAYDRSDLRGSTFLVTAIPTGLRYENGGFKLLNVLGNNDDVDCIYPAANTFDLEVSRVSPGLKPYESWPQGKRHVVNIGGNVVHYSAFNAAAAHTGGDVPRVSVSYDGGATWHPDIDICPPQSDKYLSCWAMGEYAGQQLAIVRSEDIATETTDDMILYGRRLWERRASQSIDVQTTSGSAQFDILAANAVTYGVKPGDVIQLSGFGTDVNGINLNSTVPRYTVDYVGATFVRVTHPDGDTADTTGTVTATGGTIIFNPDNAGFAAMTMNYTETTPKTGTLGTALTDDDSSPFSSFPVALHDMVCWEGAGGLDLKTGAHGGGGGGPYALQLTAVLRSTRTITRWDQIGGLTEGGEPTLHRTSDGDWYGGLRGDSTSSAEPRLFYKSGSEDLSTATTWAYPSGFGDDSPVCVAVDETNGFVYVVMTDTRYRDETPGPVPMVVGWATLANFASLGTASFDFWHLRDLHFSRTNGNTGANAVGVPSIAIYNDVLYVAYSTEHGPINFDQDGQPRVYDLALAIGPGGPVGGLLPKRPIRAPAEAARDYVVPQEFGLIGGSDDAPALTRAGEVASAFGKTLKIPSGRYTINSTVTWPNKLNVKGDGVEAPNTNTTGDEAGPVFIAGSSLSTSTMIRSYGNLRLQNLSLRGSSKTVGTGIHVRRATTDGTEYEDTDSYFNNVHVYQFDIGIQCYGRGGWVRKSFLTGCGQGFDIVWDNANFVQNTSQSFDGLDYGFRSYVLDGVRGHQTDILISNTGTDADELRGLQVLNCNMDIGAVLFTGSLKSGIFMGNMVDLANTNTGVIDIRSNVNHIQIVGNMISGAPDANDEAEEITDKMRYGIRFRAAVANFLIADNVIRRTMSKDGVTDTESAGLIFEGTATRGRITDNQFLDYGYGTTYGPGTTDEAAIKFAGAVDRVTISNDFRKEATSNAVNIDFGSQTVTRSTVTNCTAPSGEAVVVSGSYTDGGGNKFDLPKGTDPEVTIASGAITATQEWHYVDTEANAATDDLTTINSDLPNGSELVLIYENGARTVVVKHNSGGGNIRLTGGTDVSLTGTTYFVRLFKSGGNWYG